MWVRIKPPKDQDNLEGFYAARFGWRLYRTFFKTYTEKVWGVPVRELQADWGAQRVKNLSLFRAGWEAIKPKSLAAAAGQVEAGHEPDRGVQLPEVRARDDVGALHRDRHRARRPSVEMETAVTKVRHDGGRAVSVTAVTANGSRSHATTARTSSRRCR